MEKTFNKPEGSDNTMQPNSENENVTPVKTHEEIIAITRELKELEERYGAFEIVEIEEESEELIEVDHGDLPEPDKIVVESKIKKPDLDTKLKKYKIFKVKVRNKSKVKTIREAKSATFRMRFDETGNLVNLDFKKPKPKKESESKPGRLSKLKKLRKGKKGKGEPSSAEGETKDKKSKGSKLKGRIGKLKKVIPGKKSKKEKSEKKE